MTGPSLRGLSRLTVDGIVGLVGVVEAIHQNIAAGPPLPGSSSPDRSRGITGLVYASVRAVTGLVGHGLDELLARLTPLLEKSRDWPGRENWQAVLNGVLGDHLARTANPLAIPMRLRRDGRALELDARSLAAAIPRPRARLVVLVHGLCMNDRQWKRAGHDHGAALERDLRCTSIYLHYNSGLHVSTNGRAFADLLEALVKAWPVPVRELILIGHSMGGLVCRSALHYAELAGEAWPRRLRRLVFLGTPHHGAPLERGGNWIDVLLDASPYVAPLARVGKIRSAGITDLRYGNLLDADWEGRDRFRRGRDRRRLVPLPEGVACYAVAATSGRRAEDLRTRLVGDGIVPLDSALGRHTDPARALPFPKSRSFVGHGMGHLDLLGAPGVYAQIKRWLGRTVPRPVRGARGRPPRPQR